MNRMEETTTSIVRDMNRVSEKFVTSLILIAIHFV